MPGCTLLHNWKEKRRAAQEKRLRDVSKAPQLVGTITLVNAVGAFALIDSAGSPSPPAGTIIKSRTAGTESGELRVSDVRKRPFFIADVVKGTPQKGDQVFQ
jgi:hypothetical protein